MARPVDPTATYRISIHNIGGYRYASTQPAYLDPETGKTKHKRIHWGTVDESNKFIPGSKYIFASIEERSKLIFPENWDMSELEKDLKSEITATISGEVKSSDVIVDNDKMLHCVFCPECKPSI